MRVAPGYYALINTSLFDTIIVNIGRRFYRLISMLIIYHTLYTNANIWVTMTGHFISIFFFMMKPSIHNQILRSTAIAGYLLFLINTRLHIWLIICGLVEICRFSLKFGIPYLLRKFSGYIDRLTPRQQSFLRYVYNTLRDSYTSNLQETCKKLVSEIFSYDSSDGFTNEERENIYVFLNDFVDTYFIFDRLSMTIFSKPVMIRINPLKLRLISGRSIKLIPTAEDICAICRENIKENIIELTCKHNFCLQCILLWFDREYNCPTCRHVIE